MTGLGPLIDAVPYYRFLGLRPGPGDTIVLPADDRLVGDHERALLHGGVLSAFLEAAAVLHLQASGSPDPATVAISTDYLRPAPVADTAAHVSTVRRGRRVAHLRIDAVQPHSGALVAVASGSWLI